MSGFALSAAMLPSGALVAAAGPELAETSPITENAIAASKLNSAAALSNSLPHIVYVRSFMTGSFAGLVAGSNDNYHHISARLAASSAIVIMRTANFRALQDGRISVGETFSVRFIPSGVASNAQETTTTMAKPRARNTTNAFITQVGASGGSKITLPVGGRLHRGTQWRTGLGNGGG